MHFYAYGINYQQAPIDLREQVHFKETQIIDGLNGLLDGGLKEVVILSTCNRSELYLLGDLPDAHPWINDYVEGFFHVSGLLPYSSFYEDEEALLHLFKVTSGMSSLLVGEDQILGQVKEAWQTAMDVGSSGKVLNRFFREAIAEAKSVKTRGLSSHVPTSLSYVGVKGIHDELPLKDVPALVIGMGKMGALAMEHLLEFGAKVSITNRTHLNSLKRQRDFPQVEVLPYEELAQYLADFPVIVSATSSPHHTVRAEDLPLREEEIYLLDLSMPRDMDPELGKREHVHLWDIDALEEISRKNSRKKAETLEQFLPEMEEKTRELMSWFAQADLTEVMQTVNDHCEQVALDTLEYIFRKTELSHSQKMKVSKIVHSALKKVAREPVLYILNGDENREEKRRALKLIGEAYEQ
ncbi:MAG: glutamyl-tRNA reductase [Tissierellia bacterium]|nr:glutamyl-tRNA reductase [Tissierellia bacterium]